MPRVCFVRLCRRDQNERLSDCRRGCDAEAARDGAPPRVRLPCLHLPTRPVCLDRLSDMPPQLARALRWTLSRRALLFCNSRDAVRGAMLTVCT